MSPKGIEVQEAKTWVCLVCAKQYKYLGALENHIKKEHPDAWDTAKKAEEEARKAEEEVAVSMPVPAPEEEPEAVALEELESGELEIFTPEEIFTPGVGAKAIEDFEIENRGLKREIEELRQEVRELKEGITDFDVTEEESPLSMLTFPGIPTKAQKQFPFEEIWTATPTGDRQRLKEAVAKARPPAQLRDVVSFAFYGPDVVFVLIDGRKIRVNTTQK